MQINSQLTALGNVLALILASNPRFPATDESQLTLNSVTAQAVDANGKNAVANVSVAGYDDAVDFTYSQLSFGDATGQSAFAVTLETGAAASDILAAVAAAYGLIASELSLTNEADAVAGGSVAVVDAAAGTPLYLAGPISVSLTWQTPAPAPVTLASLVDSTVLDGFDVVTPAVAPAADGSDGAASDGSSTAPAADGQASDGAATDGTQVSGS
ncbi:hypothetical protein [Paraburkholderia sp. BCC1886]|uniref:hypothetical protein n=1 Tax=Paraburkholderia sp. BCC1886 TaxID=2562670 RepID=UPI001183F744|nr:hypothetical protein [Paraburkholderia sp. BCC1886]